MKALTVKQDIPEELYHGSAKMFIEEFNMGGTSLGPGLYLTDSIAVAVQYGRKRLNIPVGQNCGYLQDSLDRFGGVPTLYTVRFAENLVTADLACNENVRVLLESVYRENLADEIKQKIKLVLSVSNPHIKLQEVSSVLGKELIEKLKEQGFNSLYAYDRGEPPEILAHDAFLLFDPKKALIKKRNTAMWW